jgi:hypothetical protein
MYVIQDMYHISEENESLLCNSHELSTYNIHDNMRIKVLNIPQITKDIPQRLSGYNPLDLFQ